MVLSNMAILFVFLVSCLLKSCLANVEKTIFVAPESLTVPQDASIDNLLLISLNPEYLTVRTYINASFPTEEQPHGRDTWALLEGLTPGQRYELRVCWLATQPTEFWIYSHRLTTVFESADLITSLSTYSYAKHAELGESDHRDLQKRRFTSSKGIETSMLLLQIQAAADYFTLNETLMKNVPPVHVDLILDPYLFNVFPQSLVPTAVYIIVVAIFAWFLSAWIFRQLMANVARTRDDVVVEEKKTK